MDNPVLYVLLNASLEMSEGKAAAQAVHAVTTMVETMPTEFKFAKESYLRTVIVLAAKDEQQINNIWRYTQSAGLHSAYYIDEGANEVRPFSVTALAVEPIADDSRLRAMFAGLPLYGTHKERGWFR